MTPAPHIVVVMADQLAADALGAYGNSVVAAPHIDRLAERGVVFERAYCASPLCVPSRAALMTGLLASRSDVFDNASELAAAVPTFAHCLRRHGYRTVLCGKMHFIGPDQRHGFEERPMPDMYPAGFDWIPDWRLGDDERLSWYHDLSSVLRAGPIRQTLQLAYDQEVLFHARRAIAATARDPSRPLLLVVSFTHPHDPYEVPAALWSRYDNATIDPPTHPLPPVPTDAPSRRLRLMLDADRLAIDHQQVLIARRGYYAAVSLVDDALGALTTTLNEHGLAADTVMLLTSDHGDMRGERGLWYKMAPFEGSARVPLVVAGRGVAAARRVSQPVSLLDVSPTLAGMTGADTIGMQTDGTNLADVLAGGAEPEARDIRFEYLAEGVRSPQVSVVRGQRKLVRSLGEPNLLYDLASDPAERTDRCGDPALADEASAMMRSIDATWQLDSLDQRVRRSQEQRRLVREALGKGRVTAWDHEREREAGGYYIRTGDDFWSTLEKARR